MGSETLKIIRELARAFAARSASLVSVVDSKATTARDFLYAASPLCAATARIPPASGGSGGAAAAPLLATSPPPHLPVPSRPFARPHCQCRDHRGRRGYGAPSPPPPPLTLPPSPSLCPCVLSLAGRRAAFSMNDAARSSANGIADGDDGGGGGGGSGGGVDDRRTRGGRGLPVRLRPRHRRRHAKRVEHLGVTALPRVDVVGNVCRRAAGTPRCRVEGRGMGRWLGEKGGS